MSPAEFIPILEDAKIVYKLDLYVLEKVLEKLKKQMELGLYVVPNSINLSRTDFYACDIVEEIRSRVDKSGVDRSRITIEITESIIMEDMESWRSDVITAFFSDRLSAEPHGTFQVSLDPFLP